jgi:hypothetical protein
MGVNPAASKASASDKLTLAFSFVLKVMRLFFDEKKRLFLFCAESYVLIC